MLKINKVIPLKVANATRNPFEADKKAHFAGQPSTSTSPSSKGTRPSSDVIPIHNECDETPCALQFCSEKQTIPGTIKAADTTLFPTIMRSPSPWKSQVM